jgi:transcriptional regulator with XRE-family HTH domain
MKRYPEEFINEARKLREGEKLSYREIGRRLGVNSATVGNWFPGSVGGRWDGQVISNEKKRKKIRYSEKKVVPIFNSLDKNTAKLLAGILYGCEGSKYPATKVAAFTNSDPDLIVTFLALLRKSFCLNSEKISIHLQIHTTHNFQEVKDYWSSLLGVPEERFLKPTVTRPTGSKHRQNYRGTCTLKYSDYRVQLKLLGIFEAFVRSHKMALT